MKLTITHNNNTIIFDQVNLTMNFSKEEAVISLTDLKKSHHERLLEIRSGLVMGDGTPLIPEINGNPLVPSLTFGLDNN